MDLPDFLDHVAAAQPSRPAPDNTVHARTAQTALRIVAELNTGYRTPDEVRALLRELTGKPVDESVTVFPPFYCEFGKNLTLGKKVFINMGCTLPGHRRHHHRRRDAHRARQHLTTLNHGG